jgi:hypothetical protein
MISLYDWLNIVNPTLFFMGIVGLLGGRLSVSPDLPIVGRQARIAGVILILPFLYSIRFGSWFSLLPSVIGISAALLYLYSSTSATMPQVYKFWAVAMTPPIICYWASKILWDQVYVIAEKIYISGWIYTYSPFFVFEVFIPIAVIFLTNLIIPVANNTIKYFWFAIPLFLAHLHFAVLNWFVPYLTAIEWPEGPFGPGIIMYFIGDVLIGIFVFVIVANMAKLSYKIRLAV